MNSGGGGAYPPPGVEIEVNADGVMLGKFDLVWFEPFLAKPETK